jgi:hypothetical protein
MGVPVYFTPAEKQMFLTKLGYTIVDINVEYWDQWGNHDSQGKWVTQKASCAVKGSQATATKNDNIETVFNIEMGLKIKNLLLN